MMRDRHGQIRIRLDSLPQMRRQNENTDTTAHGIRGISSILPEVQVYLRDPFQGR